MKLAALPALPALPALALAITAALAAPAAAQPAPRTTLGADAALVLPLGDYANGISLAGGALLRVEHPLATGFLTGRAGALLHAVDGDASLTMIPLYAGFRYPVGTGGLYVAGELGITFISASVDTGLGSASDTDTELGLTLGAGLRRGALDVRGALFLPDAGDLVGIMGSVGYDFAAL